MTSGLPTATAQPKRPVSAVPVITTSPQRHRPGPDSPTRLARNRTFEETSPIRKAANALGFRSKKEEPVGNASMAKAAMRNQTNGVHGRTLVELAQARAGAVPRADKLDKMRPDCAVWDPEQDEMPSPFLQRGRKVIKNGFRY